jgi:hypothetical protein
METIQGIVRDNSWKCKSVERGVPGSIRYSMADEQLSASRTRLTFMSLDFIRNLLVKGGSGISNRKTGICIKRGPHNASRSRLIVIPTCAQVQLQRLTKRSEVSGDT